MQESVIRIDASSGEAEPDLVSPHKFFTLADSGYLDKKFGDQKFELFGSTVMEGPLGKVGGLIETVRPLRWRVGIGKPHILRNPLRHQPQYRFNHLALYYAIDHEGFIPSDRPKVDIVVDWQVKENGQPSKLSETVEYESLSLDKELVGNILDPINVHWEDGTQEADPPSILIDRVVHVRIQIWTCLDSHKLESSGFSSVNWLFASAIAAGDDEAMESFNPEEPDPMVEEYAAERRIRNIQTNLTGFTQLTREVLLRMSSFMDLVSITHLQRTCFKFRWLLRDAVGKILRVEVGRYFPLGDISHIMYEMKRWAILISGSTALRILRPSTWTPSGLNLLVCDIVVHQAIKLLTSNGYTMQSRAAASNQLSVPKEEEYEHDYQWLEFTNGNTFIDLTIVPPDISPLHAVLNSHSSAVMHFVHGEGFVSLLPRPALNGTNLKNTTAEGRNEVKAALAKYADRGYPEIPSPLSDGSNLSLQAVFGRHSLQRINPDLYRATAWQVWCSFSSPSDQYEWSS